MKCVKCGRVGDENLFNNFYGKLSKYCEHCRKSARNSMQRIKTKEQRSEDHKQWRKGNTEYQQYMFEYNLKKFTGLSLEEYLTLLSRQKGKCAICGTEAGNGRTKRLHVDHDHKTGQIRGLLCSNCNTALGLLKDDLDLLQNCIEYIKRGGQLTIDGRVQR